MFKVTATFVEEVEEQAFSCTWHLRRVSISPDTLVKLRAFFGCLSLEILAASVGFGLGTGDKDEEGRNVPTVGITRFTKWCNQMNLNMECYKTTTCMIRLCNTPITRSRMRASTEDPIWPFVAGPGWDLAKLVLSFKLGVKVGKGDPREASKAKLLEVGLELKVLRMEINDLNMEIWRAIVDDVGKLSRGGLVRHLGGGW